MAFREKGLAGALEDFIIEKTTKSIIDKLKLFDEVVVDVGGVLVEIGVA